MNVEWHSHTAQVQLIEPDTRINDETTEGWALSLGEDYRVIVEDFPNREDAADWLRAQAERIAPSTAPEDRRIATELMRWLNVWGNTAPEDVDPGWASEWLAQLNRIASPLPTEPGAVAWWWSQEFSLWFEARLYSSGNWHVENGSVFTGKEFAEERVSLTERTNEPPALAL